MLSLDGVVADEITSSSLRKVLPDCTIYLSRNDFGHPKSTPGRSKTTDFDAAVRVIGTHKTFTHPIQPRAPEVILGAPWSYPVDIWNLGTMVRLSDLVLYFRSWWSCIHKLWDLLEGKALFDGSDSNHNGEYTSHAHLAQLIDLLGPPPKGLLPRGTNSGLYFNTDGGSILFDRLFTVRWIAVTTYLDEFMAQCHVQPRRLVDSVYDWGWRERAVSSFCYSDAWMASGETSNCAGTIGWPLDAQPCGLIAEMFPIPMIPLIIYVPQRRSFNRHLYASATPLLFRQTKFHREACPL